MSARVVVVEMGEREGEQRQGVLPRYVLEQRIGEQRVDLERRLDQSRRAFDHRAIGALQHHVESECVLRQRGETRLALNQREGIRAHDQDRERARIGRQRFGQNLDETLGFVPAFLVEQLLALIDGNEESSSGAALSSDANPPARCRAGRPEGLASPSSVFSMKS